MKNYTVNLNRNKAIGINKLTVKLEFCRDVS